MRALNRVSTTILATALCATLGAATLAQPASAGAASQPPVAVDDHASAYAGQFLAVDVLKNDSDPDGDELAVCRVAEPAAGAAYYAEASGNRLFVMVPPDGTTEIAITYYACDFETLVPATLTISIKKVVPVKVEKLARPGRIRIRNDNDRRVQFLYGNRRQDKPDGRVGVAPHDSVVVRVQRHRIDWIAILARTVLAGQGRVRGIDLPGHPARAGRAALTLHGPAADFWAGRD